MEEKNGNLAGKIQERKYSADYSYLRARRMGFLPLTRPSDSDRHTCHMRYGQQQCRHTAGLQYQDE